MRRARPAGQPDYRALARLLGRGERGQDSRDDPGGDRAGLADGWIGDLGAGHPQAALPPRGPAGRLAGTSPDAIWQWAFTALVSTGLFIRSLGRREEAQAYLAVAWEA